MTVLDVLLYGEPIGTLTNVGFDRTLFAFNESYIENSNRPVLGQYFKDSFGELITEFNRTQTKLMPYFSNLLPEGHLRDNLSELAGVTSVRDFHLLASLGADLSGAVTVVYDDDKPLHLLTKE